jgi:hypothetical protein
VAGANKEGWLMSTLIGRSFHTVLICGVSFVPLAAVAATDADKVALQKATASCKAEVKEYARYNETSWWQRHKMVNKCINDALAKK